MYKKKKKTAGEFPELVSDLIDNFDPVCLLAAFPKQSSIIIINNLTIFFSVKNEFVFIVVL